MTRNSCYSTLVYHSLFAAGGIPYIASTRVCMMSQSLVLSQPNKGNYSPTRRFHQHTGTFLRQTNLPGGKQSQSCWSISQYIRITRYLWPWKMSSNSKSDQILIQFQVHTSASRPQYSGLPIISKMNWSRLGVDFSPVCSMFWSYNI